MTAHVPPIAPQALRLALEAMDVAERCLTAEGRFAPMVFADTKTLPLIPMDRAGTPRPGRGILPVVAQEMEPLRAAVRARASELEAYAILVDATLLSDDDDRELDAVVVEVGLAGEKAAYVLAQPYRLAADESYERIGEAGLLRMATNLLPSD